MHNKVISIQSPVGTGKSPVRQVSGSKSLTQTTNYHNTNLKPRFRFHHGYRVIDKFYQTEIQRNNYGGETDD